MTPSEKLKEIETDWKEYLIDPVNEDIKWLIARVKQLTSVDWEAVIEDYHKNGGSASESEIRLIQNIVEDQIIKRSTKY